MNLGSIDVISLLAIEAGVLGLLFGSIYSKSNGIVRDGLSSLDPAFQLSPRSEDDIVQRSYGG
jgi:hypothetical protein